MLNNVIDKVTLSLNGLDVTPCLKSYTMHYDMFGGAGNFSCDLIPDQQVIKSFSGGLDLNLAKQEIFFQWNFNGYPWMNGYLDKINISYDKGSAVQTLEGRDLVSVLMDNTILVARNLPPQGTTTAYGDAGSLSHILNRMWSENTEVTGMTNMNNGFQNAKITLSQPLSIKKYLNNTPFVASPSALDYLTGMPPYKRVSFSVGESLYDVVTNLCNQRGLIVYNPPGTDYILIQIAGFDAHTDPSGNQGIQMIGYDPWGKVTSNVEHMFVNTAGENHFSNILSCSVTQDITNYHKYIKLLGEAMFMGETAKEVASATGVQFYPLRIERIDSIPDLNFDGTPLEGEITPQFMKRGYNGVTKFKTALVDTLDEYTWNKVRNLLINNDLFTQNRELYNIKYTVVNHSPDGQLPYFFGQYAKVDDDFLNIKDINFLIYSVTYTGSKESGLKTELELASPTNDNNRPYYGPVSEAL